MTQSTVGQLQRLAGEDGLADVHITAHDDVWVTHVSNPVVTRRRRAVAATDDELLAAVSAIGGPR